MLGLIVVMTCSAQQASDLLGTWVSVDDATGKHKSEVTITREADGTFAGTVTKILPPAPQDALCEACEGNDKNKPILGLKIIKDMKWNDGELSDGEIMDPENGKTYRCKIWLDTDNLDLLNVRGYVAFFYRTQTWIRKP